MKKKMPHRLNSLCVSCARLCIIHGVRDCSVRGPEGDRLIENNGNEQGRIDNNQKIDEGKYIADRNMETDNSYDADIFARELDNASQWSGIYKHIAPIEQENIGEEVCEAIDER